MHFIKEIKAIGFINWFWFTFILRKNEFHASLNKSKRNLHLKREKAHIIDMKLENLNNKE